MKIVMKRLLFVLAGTVVITSVLNAKGWVIVEPSDGAQLVCCKKHYKPAPRKKVVKRDLTPCDKIPTAKTMPLKPGEKLAPADIKRCISCDQKYGAIGK